MDSRTFFRPSQHPKDDIILNVKWLRMRSLASMLKQARGRPVPCLRYGTFQVFDFPNFALAVSNRKSERNPFDEKLHLNR